MSASAALATIAVANSAVADASAREALTAARRAECKAEMPLFTDSGSSIAAKRQYAACVEVLHPSPSEPPTIHEKALVSGLVGAVLVAAIIGAWRFYKDFSHGSSIFMGSFVGAGIGVILAALILAACAFVRYLAS